MMVVTVIIYLLDINTLLLGIKFPVCWVLIFYPRISDNSNTFLLYGLVCAKYSFSVLF